MRTKKEHLADMESQEPRPIIKRIERSVSIRCDQFLYDKLQDGYKKFLKEYNLTRSVITPNAYYLTILIDNMILEGITTLKEINESYK